MERCYKYVCTYVGICVCIVYVCMCVYVCSYFIHVYVFVWNFAEYGRHEKIAKEFAT